MIPHKKDKSNKFTIKQADELDEYLVHLYPEPHPQGGDEHIFSLSMLDGYFAAVLLCPDFVDRSDWYEGILQEHTKPNFTSVQQQQRFTQLLDEYYQKIKTQFDQGLIEYEPMVYHEMVNEQVMPAIDLWLDGFERGFEYFENAWKLNASIDEVIDQILSYDDICQFETLNLVQRNKAIEKLADLVVQLQALNNSNPLQ